MPMEASVERRLYALRQSPPCTAPKSTNSSGCVPSCEGGFAAGSWRSCTMSATSRAPIVSRGRARPYGAWETSRPHLPIPAKTVLPPAQKQVSVPKATSLALTPAADTFERQPPSAAKRDRGQSRLAHALASRRRVLLLASCRSREQLSYDSCSRVGSGMPASRHDRPYGAPFPGAITGRVLHTSPDRV